MSAARHTPGPWFVPRVSETQGGNSGASVWALGGDVIIAESPSRSLSLEGRRANARLIAASPDLLTTLTQLAFMARTSGNPTPELIRACEGAEALIGKTMGGASCR
jgi:hypothetical protein